MREIQNDAEYEFISAASESGEMNLTAARVETDDDECVFWGESLCD